MAEFYESADGARTVVLDEVDSTNSEAMRRVQAGERGPLWILAHRQLAGRGRSGRIWDSEPGNFYGSFLVTLSCPPGVVHQLSLLAGVAVVDAIRAIAREQGKTPGPRLKWPNDVLIGDAKCVGILPESVTRPGTREMSVVLGIGINLTHTPSALDRAATCLADHGVTVTPESMLAELMESIDDGLAIWDNGAGFPAVRAQWLGRAGPVGERITVNAGEGPIEGTFLDIDAQGALVMRDLTGRQRRVTYGDVTLARAPAGPRG